MNYTFTDNPGNEQGIVIATNGVAVDAKAAKLNNDVKRPAVKANWVKGRMPQVAPVAKDYSAFLNSVGITVVNFGRETDAQSTKKLRVNKLVNDKARVLYGATERIDIAPVKEEVPEEKVVVAEETPLTPNIVPETEDVRGRHERTGEIPVNDIKEAINEAPVPNNIVQFPTRAERNATPEVAKPETKGGDIDLYNDLLHNVSQGNDNLSHQLQGALDKLSEVTAQKNQLAEKYAMAFKDYEQLQRDVKALQEKQETQEKLSVTLDSIKKIENENLARTGDLADLAKQIEKLKKEKQALEARAYDDNYGMGKAA